MPSGIFLLDGPAADLQRRSDATTLNLALVQELGPNYESYHQQLTAAWSQLGGRPEPNDFNGDFPGYLAANARMMAVLSTEVQLRSSRLMTLGRKATNAAIYELPLVDANEQLVNVLAPPPPSELIGPKSRYANHQTPSIALGAPPAPQAWQGIEAFDPATLITDSTKLAALLRRG